ncbi:MAG: DUF4595 domain-containing protein [Roseburia sp.]|nr:DUF4595 domain-containing protein [Roseburia sp.]
MKHFLWVLACMAAFCTSCSDDDKDDTIKIAKGEKNQTAYADETGRTINFTAAEAWSTAVKYAATRAEETDEWVTLDPSSGEAGEVTISVTLDKNFTGKNRRAEITIICGDTRVTVIIEQDGKTEDGEIPDEDVVVPDPGPQDARRIARIIEHDGDAPYRLDFTYDEQGRILTYKSWEWDGSAFVKDIDASYTYYDDRVICQSSSYDGNTTYSGTSNATLKDGRITESENTVKGSHTEHRTYEYDAEGRLTKLTTNDGTSTYSSALTWKDGVIASITFQDGSSSPQQETYEYYDTETVAPKPLAFDFIAMAFGNVGEYEDMLTGYVNVFSDRYAKKVTTTGDEWNKDNGTDEYRYETDVQGYVTKVYRTWTPTGEAPREEYLMWEIEYE